VSFAEGELLGEDLGHVGEGFELKSVAGGVVEEHGSLFADFALEADVGFDFELLAGGLEAGGKGFPLVHGEDDPEVRYGNGMAVDRVVVFGRFLGARGEVGDNLVAEELKSIHSALERPSGQPRVWP
jgi:hypothetical protein